MEESEKTLIIKELKGEYPPFDSEKFDSPVHQRSLKRYVETEEELAVLKENLKKMDEGIFSSKVSKMPRISKKITLP